MYSPRAKYTLCVAACALGIGLLALLSWPLFAHIPTGANDFLPLFAGAKLVGTGSLYVPSKYGEVYRQLGYTTSESIWQYPRLPFQALLMRPFSWLPYLTAYAAWQGLSFASLIGFALLWPSPSRCSNWLALAFSYPLVMNLAHSQDVTFLLLAVAVLVRWEASGRDFWVGLFFSLALVKFHLFFPLPFVLATQRRWRILGGLAAGGAMLLLLSTFVEGFDWPLRYWEIIRTGKIDSNIAVMPTIRDMLGRDQSLTPELIAAAVILSGTVLIAVRSDLRTGLAAALVGGILISHHSYVHDCLLLVPASLIVLCREYPFVAKVAAFTLLVPTTYLLLAAQIAPVAFLLQWSMIALLISLAWDSWRKRRATVV